MLQGQLISLTPAALCDRGDIYNWCFHSETTKSHAGPPEYPDIQIPTFEEFFESYEDYYFTGEAPEKGRGFLILHNGAPVGFISYASFHTKPHIAELDLWMNAEANCGRGFGTDALCTLSTYLADTLGMQKAVIRPSRKNLRAVRSYEKAGFVDSPAEPDVYLRAEYVPIYGGGDYGTEDSALLIKPLTTQES